MGNDKDWPAARLIPVSGIGSDKEAETRAASAALAVIGVVRDLSVALFAPFGAPRARNAAVGTFTEAQFKLNGRQARPDGLVQITYGKKTWTTLIEIKTGDARLDAEQVNTYWALARQEGFDAVITISNEIAAQPGAHPTEGLSVRSNSKVKVHHLSWTALLSTAVKLKVHKGVEDPEQAWLLGELIRYLEHPASGAMAFGDMGPHWIAVRDGARDGGLSRNAEGVQDIVQRWDQLIRFAALTLGANIGSDVQQVLSRAHTDPKARLAHLAEALAGGEALDGTLRVPDTVGNIEVKVDLKARRISAAITVGAPDDRGGRARCTWLQRQLKDAPRDLVIEAFWRGARQPNSVSLAEAEEDRDALPGSPPRDLTKFRLVLTREMGVNRRKGSRKPGFIDSVLSLIEDFYGSVVQSLTPWTRKAPKISRPKDTPEPPPDPSVSPIPLTPSDGGSVSPSGLPVPQT